MSPTARAYKTETIQKEIKSLEPWFHNLHLPAGIQTAPHHFLGDFPSFKWQELAPSIPNNLTGWSALDIGCNAGFYSFELARRGANVVGIDMDAHYLAQAQWAAEIIGTNKNVQFEQKMVYDLAYDKREFDLVLFMGVLYHMRYPMLGLDIVSKKARQLMVFQTMTMPGDDVYEDSGQHGLADRGIMLEPGWPKMSFMEHRFENDPTNWWALNHACVEAMLRSAGMEIIGRPGHEMYLCRPKPKTAASNIDYNCMEYNSAIGRNVISG